MPSTIISTDFIIKLETNEEIHVVELDPERVIEITNEKVKNLIDNILSRCTKMPRHVVETAKLGGTREFEKLMSTPPIGCLLKIDKPVCAEINTCLSANKQKCTTRFLNVKSKTHLGRFPVCWEYDTEKAEDDIYYMARNLASFIILSWKINRLVVIIE